jgi:hypothetical protein
MPVCSFPLAFSLSSAIGGTLVSFYSAGLKRNRLTFLRRRQAAPRPPRPLPTPFRRGLPVSPRRRCPEHQGNAMGLAPKRQLRSPSTNNSSHLQPPNHKLSPKIAGVCQQSETNFGRSFCFCRWNSKNLIVVGSANMLPLKAFSLKGEKKTRLGGTPPAWLRACQPQRSCLEFLLRRKRWDRNH